MGFQGEGMARSLLIFYLNPLSGVHATAARSRPSGKVFMRIAKTFLAFVLAGLVVPMVGGCHEYDRDDDHSRHAGWRDNNRDDWRHDRDHDRDFHRDRDNDGWRND